MTENNPAPSSPSQLFPNLGNVITTDDVSQKGTGSYKADYVNWCRTMHLLHEHAPGFQFHLAHYVDSGHVWKAPNGTAYVVGYFTGPDGQRTPDFPQAVMDNRNKAIPLEKITARDITDTQRRGMCMAAAMTFGLAYELWAKMPLESGYAAPVEEAPTPAPKTAPAATKAPSAEAAKASEATFREAALEKGVHTVAIDALVKIVGEKLGGDFEKGLGVLAGKSAEELNTKYGPKKGPTQW